MVPFKEVEKWFEKLIASIPQHLPDRLPIYFRMSSLRNQLKRVRESERDSSDDFVLLKQLLVKYCKPLASQPNLCALYSAIKSDVNGKGNLSRLNERSSSSGVNGKENQKYTKSKRSSSHDTTSSSEEENDISVNDKGKGKDKGKNKANDSRSAKVPKVPKVPGYRWFTRNMDLSQSRTARKIPYMESLGMKEGADYICVSALGDGKCFFHSVCDSLNCDYNNLMDALFRELSLPLPPCGELWKGTYYNALHFLATAPMPEFFNMDLPWSRSTCAKSSQLYWNAFKADGTNGQANHILILYTAKLLLQKGIGLLVIDNDAYEGGTFDNFRHLAYAEVLSEWVLKPTLLFSFGELEQVPEEQGFEKVRHIMVVNKSFGHYDSTFFRCTSASASGSKTGKRSKDTGEFTPLPCIADFDKVSDSWKRFKNALYQNVWNAVSVASNVHGGCDSLSQGYKICHPRDFKTQTGNCSKFERTKKT
jgi:hypothetical protein